MNSRLHFNLLTQAECTEAARVILALPLTPAITQGGPSERRKGRIAWIGRSPETEWLHEKIEAVGRSYAADRNIDVEQLSDPLQAAVYSPDSRFDWHIDVGDDVTRFRKITVSVQLSDEREYDGGNLELVGEYFDSLRRLRGSAVAFPAVIGHRLTSITRGERLAVIGWLHGPAYR